MSTNHVQAQDTPAAAPSGSAFLRWLGRIVRLLLVAAILAAGGWVSYYWMTHKPKARRRPPEAQATLVEVSPVSPRAHKVVVSALGTVVPARSIQLAARVGGEVVAVNPQFIPGGQFAANQRILRIEPRDYALVVQQRASELAKVESDLKLEMGQQSVSQREYQLLGQEIKEADRELLLRGPQLATAKAAVASAQAALEKARLDLGRTDVDAPFNAMVQSRAVDLGSQVSVGMALASLVGTDEYWVQVSVPIDQLKWIRVPGIGGAEGSPVRVYHEAAWEPDAFRTGKVHRLMTDLEPQGRMARLLVAVADPLGVKAPPAKRHSLILGSYVRVEIDGKDLPNVVRVPRTAVRDGTHVWVMGADGTLDIRDVKAAWSGNDHVYVTDGLADGDLLVTSDLAAASQGTALRTGESPGKPSPQRLADGAGANGQPEGRK